VNAKSTKLDVGPLTPYEALDWTQKVRFNGQSIRKELGRARFKHQFSNRFIFHSFILGQLVLDEKSVGKHFAGSFLGLDYKSKILAWYKHTIC